MGCEVSWFAALCDDDYEFLGVPEPALQSSWDHCRTIALAAEAGGYDNLLLPSGYAMGIDSVSFAAGIAPVLQRMQLLVAVRMGEMWAPQLARQLATLDQMLGGRLTVNIISSDLPGQKLDSGPRYQRTLEIMRVLRDLLGGLSTSVREELDMRRKINADRRATRRSVQIVVIVAVAVALLLGVFNHSYVEIYDAPLGQVVLLVVAGFYAAGFFWLRKLARFDAPERLLSEPLAAGAALGAPETVAGWRGGGS